MEVHGWDSRTLSSFLSPATPGVDAVFKKYGTTEAVFDSSLVWYTRNTEVLSKIYERVSKRLKAQQNEINHLTLYPVFPWRITEFWRKCKGGECPSSARCAPPYRSPGGRFGSYNGAPLLSPCAGRHMLCRMRRAIAPEGRAGLGLAPAQVRSPKSWTMP